MEKHVTSQSTVPLKSFILCLALLLLFLLKSPSGYALDHFFIIKYEGSKTCRVCHPDEVDDVTHSIHYRLLGDVQGVFDMFSNKPITGQWGKGNRYLGLPGGLVGANWAEKWVSNFDPQHAKSSGCGICHVAAGFDALPVNPDGSPRPLTDEAKDQLDCVLCHGKTYNGGGPDGQRVVLSDESDHNYWSLASSEDARTVGDPVEPSACKRCHVNSGGKVFSPDGTMSKSYKYGTDYVAESYQFTYDNGSGMMETATINGDVHAAAGIRCAECHFIKDEEGNTQHKVQYGPHNVSWAHDQVPDNFSCTTSNCHSLTPHSESSNFYKVYLDTHTQALACQTCHITKTGGLMKRDLRRPILPDEDAHFYEFKDEVHYGVNPEYRWFNGNSGGWEAVLEGPCPIGPQGSKDGNRNNDGSKITPFKRYQALLWFDLGLLQPVPYTLTDFIVDGDLEAAANNGMNASGWVPDGRPSYNFRLRRLMGLVIPFPMACALKIDHGVQTGPQALGYATQGNVSGCNYCHSTENKSFWKFLGYTRSELRELQKPRTP